MRTSGAKLELVLFALAVGAALLGFGPPRVLVGYTPPPRPASGLRIVTWNVGVASDGDEARRERELEGVRETLLRLDPDVAVLQEIGERELEDLADALTDARTAFVGGAQSSCGVVVQRGRLAGIDGEEHHGRAPVRVVYRPEQGPWMQLLGLHADPWSATARNAQIGRAVDLLAEADGVPLRVLAGDLNLDVDLGGGKDLFTEDEYLDVQTYNYAAERMLDAAAGTGPTAEPDRRLDYVFVASDVVRVGDAGVWRDRRVGGMDHHPVVVDLE